MEWVLTLDNMKKVAKEFLHYCKGKKLFAFHGQMGSGKTTFIHALCDEMKVSSTVASPTFSIVNEYVSPRGKIYHIDLYRLEDEDDAIRAGVEDCLYSGDYCMVEWPDRASGILPPETVHVYMTLQETQDRKIHAEATA
jgi:tRNA threonylcarbamoyladenosine biosynthesis protein TsaE